MFVFFSEIQDVRVLDLSGKTAGRLVDIIIEPIGKYARAKALIIERGFFVKSRATVSWGGVAAITKKAVRVKEAAPALKFVATADHRADLSLRQDILDQQVVDTNNQNVIRVNDIHLLFAEQDLVVAHVDIGLRGIVRRLGWEKLVDGLVRFFNKNADYLRRTRLVSWKHIQPLSINPASMTIKVDVSQKQLLDIPAEDLGEIMLDLAPKHRLALFKTLELGAKAQLFRALEFKEQRSLLEDLSDTEAVEILNQLPSDEAVDFLGELPNTSVRKILGQMESKSARMLSQLLGYASESAGGLMTTEFIAVPATASIDETLKVIKEKTPKAETIQSIYIVDAENHLVGVTFLRRLIISDPADNVMKASLKKVVSIRPEDDVQKIALLMDKYGFFVLPVVDAANILVGIITIDDIFSRLVTIAFRRAHKKKELYNP
jgi:magnesium transporter